MIIIILAYFKFQDGYKKNERYENVGKFSRKGGVGQRWCKIQEWGKGGVELSIKYVPKFHNQVMLIVDSKTLDSFIVFD